jgi:preprotein translocase subunit SecY
MNLLQIAIPQLEAMAKEGEEGRKKIARFTRYGTVVLALIQAFGISVGVFGRAFINPGPGSTAIAVMTLTAGTAFLMYLGEKINENGIGNGISMFIFAGILANIPFDIKQVLSRIIAGELGWLHLLLFFAISVVIIAGVIFIQQGSRKIPVQYAKRVVGRKMYGGHSTHIPLKVNQAGVIPVIFSISILMMPITIAQFWSTGKAYSWLSNNFNQASILYNILNAVLIVAFTYFYTSVTFNPVDVSDNLKKNGGFVPGIRPGKPTTEYLERTLYRITFAGGIFLALIATIPNVILALTNMKLSFGGTSILIAVGVSLETYKQIEAHITMRHYQGFLK